MNSTCALTISQMKSRSWSQSRTLRKCYFKYYIYTKHAHQAPMARQSYAFLEKTARPVKTFEKYRRTKLAQLTYKLPNYTASTSSPFLFHSIFSDSCEGGKTANQPGNKPTDAITLHSNHTASATNHSALQRMCEIGNNANTAPDTTGEKVIIYRHLL